MGGTTTAHVIIVEPLQNGVTLPAVTLTSGLFVFSNLQKEGSCPMDSTSLNYLIDFILVQVQFVQILKPQDTQQVPLGVISS